MFKKSSDSAHYLERTGSHSTKGSRSGRAPWRLPDEFMSVSNILARREEIHALREVVRAARVVIAGSDNRSPGYYRALRNVRKSEKRISELRSVTPVPLPQVVQPDVIERRKARRAEMIAKYAKPRRKEAL